MTTPPLDLPALRDDLRMSTGRTFPIYREELQALLDRLVNAESAWTNWQNVGLGMQARTVAAERDLAAVTVSRDGWQTRAKAAEKKVAAVIDWCDTNQHPFHPSEGAVGFSRQDWALDDAARRIRTMLTTPETETTP